MRSSKNTNKRIQEEKVIKNTLVEVPLNQELSSDFIPQNEVSPRISSCGVVFDGTSMDITDDILCQSLGVDISTCSGCKSFQRCCSSREITHCYECKIYPCTKFKSIATAWKKRGQDLKFNQKILEVMGESYLQNYYNTKIAL